MNKKGFTLIEMTAAIFIFSIAAIFAANIMIFSVNNFNRLRLQSEIKEEAWVSLDFLVNSIKYCNGYKISYRSDNTLRRLDLFTALTEGAAEHNYIFVYDKGNEKLSFGGANEFTSGGTNDLALNISNFSVSVNEEKELLYISITAKKDDEEFRVDTCVSLKYKEKR